MKATTVKQIKFNRGQVTDLLSERVDMGLQNACGTVYDNMYINRYGQLQNAPVPVNCYNNHISSSLRAYVLCMFDTGTDLVYPILYEPEDRKIQVLPGLSKTDAYRVPTNNTPVAEYTLVDTSLASYYPNDSNKVLQFGYNVLIYGIYTKPLLLNLVPGTDWTNPTLTVKEHYFDNAFDNIFVRGINTEPPAGFTPPTSGYYTIPNQTTITSKKTVTLQGSDFVPELVGQVLMCDANGGSLQIKEYIDANNLVAYVLSPLISLSATDTAINIPFATGESKWVFGYERAYGDTAGPNSTPSYPDSAIYVNQRLVFGGNDYHGSLISASRIGIINDFDPESATESDAFTTAIASKDFCRIVNFTVSNNELRIACTNGEYAMPLENLTPTGSLGGFDLRSEIGIKTGTAICDCGGLTTYISNDGNSVYGTQFSLLRDRYQPISLTSQTDNIVNNCRQLVYLTNRKNNEGNCLVGLNEDTSMFIGSIDLNAGLIGLTKINKLDEKYNTANGLKVEKLYAVGDCLYASVSTRFGSPYGNTNRLLVRFVLGEMFALPVWYNYWEPGSVIPGTAFHPNDIVIPANIRERVVDTDSNFRALYFNSAENKYELIKTTGTEYNADDTYSLLFDDSIDKSNIVVAGFVRQSDWRSVEIGVGIATRELNKRIIKLEGVIEPRPVTGAGNVLIYHHRFAGLTLTYEQAKDLIMLTRSKDVEAMDIDNLSNTSYTENEDLVWRRAFDNPDRELHYGLSMVAPFLVKSLTATIEYDEVQ